MIAVSLSGQPAILAGVLAAGDPDSFWAKAYPIIPHPAEIIVGTIAFIILYFVMSKKAVPAFEAMYEERTAAIEGGMKEAEEAQAEADALLAEYKAQLANAREEATRIREQARTDAADIAAQVRDKASSDADRIMSTAHKQIDADRSLASTQLQGELGRLATDLASKIVGESLHDNAMQRRVIDRFIGDLEQAAPAETAASKRDA